MFAATYDGLHERGYAVPLRLDAIRDDQNPLWLSMPQCTELDLASTVAFVYR